MRSAGGGTPRPVRALRRGRDRPMDPQIEIFGLVVSHPWTAVTNLALAAECFLMGWIVARRDVPQACLRACFLFALGWGALFGVTKHGFPDMAGHNAIRFASNLGLGSAVTFAQLAAIRVRVSAPAPARVLTGLALLQFSVFLGVSVVNQDFVVPGLHLALGMPPILVAASWSALRGCRASRWTAAGLLIALGAGVVYALEVGLNAWFNHLDVAHLLLGCTVALMFVGFHLPQRDPRPEIA